MSHARRGTRRCRGGIGFVHGGCRSDPKKLDGVIVAIVSVPPAANAIELVAHEMEHVIERVEGRDLPREARRRASGVWETFRGRFESRRAIEVGRQVAGK